MTRRKAQVEWVKGISLRWDKNGQCLEQVDDGPTFGPDAVLRRRPEYDYGTPMGDLLIAPWIQDAMKDAEK